MGFCFSRLLRWFTGFSAPGNPNHWILITGGLFAAAQATATDPLQVAPYLHDGRATTLTEAILEHGGDAAASRDLAAALPEAEFQNLIAFLDNLVLFKLKGEEPVVFEDRRRRERRQGQSREKRDGNRRR